MSSKKKILLEDWLYIWLENNKKFVKESTYGNYSTKIANYIIPHMGNMCLEEINEEDIQKFALELLYHGRKKGKGGLAEKTVRDTVNVLRESLKSAVRKGLIHSADYKILFPVNLEKRKMSILSEHDEEILMQYICKYPDNRNIGILLSLKAGLRVGEICALQWKDFDLDSKKVEITKTLQRVYVKPKEGRNNSFITITSPKTCSSIRSVPLSGNTVRVLQEICGREEDSKEVYLLTGKKKYMEPRSYATYYKHFLKNVDINYINFHGLRHTFATRLIDRGADYKTVSVLLGHKSITTTLDLYVHPQTETQRRCIELLDNT